MSWRTDFVARRVGLARRARAALPAYRARRTRFDSARTATTTRTTTAAARASSPRGVVVARAFFTFFRRFPRRAARST
jgi:hypothetical protein